MLSAATRRALSSSSSSSSSRAAASAPRARAFTQAAAHVAALNRPLEETDPELYDIIEHEKQRQRNHIVLIASENFTSQAVIDAVGSVMTNKYSEGYPGARYYGGNEFIDAAESLCQRRALEAYGVDDGAFAVNVQALSGSPANFIAFTALMKPHERIMGLDLPHGGHLSHGYQIPTKKISHTSTYFETMPYRLDEATGRIDYDALAASAALFRPKVLIAGTSAYSREIDYARMREIADDCGAYLLADMAHISGLVAAGVTPSPFPYADVVTTTTHKSLRGPRGAMIFSRDDERGIPQAVNDACFPGLQGGPHNHTITALATALKQAQTPEYREYQEAVVANSQALADGLMKRGFTLVSNGTDNHLVLVDLRDKGVNGAQTERALELSSVTTNKNTVPGDKSALVPHGIRLGTPAMTSRGLGESDFDAIAGFFARGVEIAGEIKAATGKKKPKLSTFEAAIDMENGGHGIVDLRSEVEDFTRQFPVLGFDVDSMRYPNKTA